MENKELLTTKEVAQILKINEKKVYTLAQAGLLPATKITGKWIFPKDEILEYIKISSLNNISNNNLNNLLENKLILISGSDDFILPFIFEKYFNKSNNRLFYSNVGSKNGINDLIYHRVHFATSHIYDFKENDFNITYLKKEKVLDMCVVINLFFREIGFVSRADYNSITEFNNNGYKMIQRQEGSGIRMLQEHLIKQNQLVPNKVLSQHIANTHFEVGLLGQQNDKLYGITTKSIAKLFNLKFRKIYDERFDLITLKKYFFHRSIQDFLNFIKDDAFENIATLEGYNLSQKGKIIS